MEKLKTNQEERAAVQELLKKIPEDELNKAVGGLSAAATKILAIASIFGAGVAAGALGTIGVQHLRNEGNSENTKTAGIPGTPIQTSSGYTISDELLGKIENYIASTDPTKCSLAAVNDPSVKKIYDQFVKENNITSDTFTVDNFLDWYNKQYPNNKIPECVYSV